MADNSLPTPTPPTSSSGQVGQTPTPIKPPPSTLSQAPKEVPPPSVGGATNIVPPPNSGTITPPPAPDGSLPEVVDPTLPAPTPDQLQKIAQMPGMEKKGNDPSVPVGKEDQAAVKQEVPQIVQPGQKSKSMPKFANFTKGPVKKFLPFIIGGVVILLVAVIAFAFMSRGGSSSTSVSVDQADPSTTNNNSNTGTTGTTGNTNTKQVVLTYWGLWESASIIEPILRDFEAANPGVLVKYVKQSHKDYRERLQTAIASGEGPDVFRYHASWVPMLSEDLAAMPSSVMSPATYKQSFYQIATQQLQYNGQIVGIPLMYDNLMLYYNQEIFATASVEPPKTWAELKEIANTLTITKDGEIERAGVALGNATNVEHFSDVMGLLMLQNGADFTDPTSKAAQDALTFYTNFQTTDKVWSEKLPSSTAAFAKGDVAMMFAPSWRAHDVLAMNPNLKFKMVATPKLADKDITWASYWAEGVNAKGKNKDFAWALLKYLSSSDVMKKLYANESAVRAFGEPYSLVSLSSTVSTDPYVAPVLAGAENAQSWYLNSYTHDNGINDQLIKYYTDAVNAVTSGDKDVDEAMATVKLGTTQVLRQFGVN